MSTLNMDYDISNNLYSLYDFMYWRLVDANIKKDKAIVEEIIVFAEERRYLGQGHEIGKRLQVVNQ